MKCFIVKIGLFFLMVVAMDVSFGCFCKYFYKHAKGGETLNQKYILQDMSADVLIMGSSRARHHYQPQIIEDSLGLSVYNCGLDGNGIIYQYGLLELILKRYVPQVIVYDVTKNFDIRENSNEKYLNNLKMHFDEPSTKALFKDVDNKNYPKMFSNLYRFNWTYLTFIRDFSAKKKNDTLKGFEPVKGIMDYEPERERGEAIVWDNVKNKYFDRFVRLCKKNHIRLVVTFSPFYDGFNKEDMDPVIEYCLKNDIPLLNYNNLSSISKNKSFFADRYHLNENGAEMFSSIFAHDLKKIVSNALPMGD